MIILTSQFDGLDKNTGKESQWNHTTTVYKEKHYNKETNNKTINKQRNNKQTNNHKQ